MHDGREIGQNLVDAESSFSKMKRLLFDRIRQPGRSILSVAKEFGFEDALIFEKKGKGDNSAAMAIDYDKLSILDILQKLESLQSSPETTPEVNEPLEKNPADPIKPATDIPNFKIEKNSEGLLLPQTITVENKRFVTQEPNYGHTPNRLNEKTLDLTENERLKKSKKRSRLLVELLTELNLPYEVKLGNSKRKASESDEMIARWSKNFGDDILFYQTFILPTLRKIILVSNGPQAATHIVHDLKEVSSDWINYASMDNNELSKQDRKKVSWVKHNDSLDAIGWKEKIKADIESNEYERIRETGRERKTVQEALGDLLLAYEKWKHIAKKDELFNSEWLVNNGFSGLRSSFYRASKVKLIDLVDMSGHPDLQRDFHHEEKTKITSKADAITMLKDIFKTWEDDTDPQKGNLSIAYIRRKKKQILYDWSIKEGNPNLHQLAEETNNPKLIAEIQKIKIYKK